MQYEDHEILLTAHGMTQENETFDKSSNRGYDNDNEKAFNVHLLILNTLQSFEMAWNLRELVISLAP